MTEWRSVLLAFSIVPTRYTCASSQLCANAIYVAFIHSPLLLPLSFPHTHTHDLACSRDYARVSFTYARLCKRCRANVTPRPVLSRRASRCWLITEHRDACTGSRLHRSLVLSSGARNSRVTDELTVARLTWLLIRGTVRIEREEDESLAIRSAGNSNIQRWGSKDRSEDVESVPPPIHSQIGNVEGVSF